jgi:aminoglycoside 6'-N-acetyltransferase I
VGTPRVVPLAETTPAQRERAAAILVAALAHAPAAWKELDDAREEVATFFTDPGRTAWAALDGDALDGEALVGWVGAVDGYEGHVWELHPLVVDPAHQRRGVGAALVRALEDAGRAAGVLTVTLGTDDDFGGTTIFGVDVYDDLPGHIARLAPRDDAPATHPVNFYRRMGYTVVGLVPDANGVGRHDIIMARSLRATAGPDAAGHERRD